jgi:hypothetical protein
MPCHAYPNLLFMWGTTTVAFESHDGFIISESRSDADESCPSVGKPSGFARNLTCGARQMSLPDNLGK